MVKWDTIALAVALAIVFGLEMLGVSNTKHYMTITYIARLQPRWLRAMELGWLCYHFMIQ
jgi:hypothetical protein